MDKGRPVFDWLPKPWSMQFSKKRNMVYFFNNMTGESLWSPPKGASIGGEVVGNSESRSDEQQQIRETKESQSNVRLLPCALRTTPSVLKNSASAACSRSAVTPGISGGSSTGSDSETVSSSIARKRKSSEQFPHTLLKQKFKKNVEVCGSSTPVSHAEMQTKHDRTPAASRLEKLKNLLQEIQEKKTTGKAGSPPSTNTSLEEIRASSLDVDRKRSRTSDDSSGKRPRLEVSSADTSNTSQTGIQASCVVTSTTVSSSTSRIPDYVSSEDENTPESPKPGEKLPYLDSDTENTSEAEGDIISSASKTGQKSISKPGNNVGCKTEEKLLLYQRRKLVFNEQIDVNCTPPNTRVSVQSRLTTASTEKSNINVSVTNKIEGASSSLNEELALNISGSTNFTSPNNSSLQGRPIKAALDKGDSQSNENSKAEKISPVRPVKHSTSIPSERYVPYTRVSVQNRLIIAASGKASTTQAIPSRTNVPYSNTDDSRSSTFQHSRAELRDDSSSAIAKFRERIALLASDKITVDNSKLVSSSHVYGDTKLRQIELEPFNRISAEHSSGYDSLVTNPNDSLSFTSVQNNPGLSSRKNVLHSNSDDKKITFNDFKPDVSDDSLLAVVNFRARIAALLPDKMVDSTKCVSTGYDSLVTNPSERATTALAEEENMEVDMAFSDSPEKVLFNDTVSVASCNSEKPAIKPERTEEVNKWLHQCEPSSPVASRNLFFAEEPSDDDEPEEAMEWEDIEDDLSQVVSVLPKKSADADEWFIVVDTNILLHHLGIVEELRDTPFSKLGLPVLVIPWLVLQELDSLKAQRGQHKSKDPALCSKARWAVQFLNNNLKKGHPRVRGQTAQESEVKHYKRQGADDGILQCCLQLKEKGNFAVILTNDKNLANKAIVSGISSFTADEIIGKLHKMDFQLQVPKSRSQAAPTSSVTVSRVSTSDPTDLEKTKVDLVFCHLKQFLKDLFAEVLMSGMKKLYGDNWQSRTIRKPPWTLADIVYCILKHWDVMKEFEFKRSKWSGRDEKFKSCAKDVRKYMSNLQTFLKNSSQKCFSFVATDLKDIISWSIDVCIGMTADSFKEKVIETINKLEVLRDICKEKSRDTVMTMLSDIQASTSSPTTPSPTVKTEKAQLKYVRGKFIEAWTLMANVIGSLCDKLDIKHNIEYEVKYEFENANHICNKTAHIWPHLKALNRCFQMLEMTPLEDLSENHQVITDMYFNLKNIYLDCEQDIDDILSPQLVYTFLTHPKGWKRILHIKEEFEKYEEYLMTGIVLVSEKYPNFVVLNQAANVPVGNQAINNVQK